MKKKSNTDDPLSLRWQFRVGFVSYFAYTKQSESFENSKILYESSVIFLELRKVENSAWFQFWKGSSYRQLTNIWISVLNEKNFSNKMCVCNGTHRQMKNWEKYLWNDNQNLVLNAKMRKPTPCHHRKIKCNIKISCVVNFLILQHLTSHLYMVFNLFHP